MKAAKFTDEIVGTDRKFENATKAQKRGAIDKAERKLFSAVEGANLVVIAAPVMAIKETMELIGPELAPGTVVTDTGSSKSAVLAWAREYLGEKVHFVGGDPMVSKEGSGPDAASADLFKGKPYCVLPAKGTNEDAVALIVGMVKEMGAIPYFLDAGEHDSFVAAVAHLPMLLSATLVNCTAKSPSWVDISKLAANEYKDVTRPSARDPEGNRDVCITNAVGISHWIDAFIGELQQLKGVIGRENNAEELKGYFESAWENHERWAQGLVRAPQPASAVQNMSFGQQMGEMFFGSRLMEVQKRLFKDTDGKRDGKPKSG